MPDPNEWIVKVFDHRPYCYEVSVVRRNFRMGRRSMGKFCECKKMVAASDEPIPDWLFLEFKRLAKRYAQKLNEERAAEVERWNRLPEFLGTTPLSKPTGFL